MFQKYILIAFSVLFTGTLLELGAQLFLEHRSDPPEFEQAMKTIQAPNSEGLFAKQLTLVPHPYFGYVFPPKHRLYQAIWVDINSQGFVDQEFPAKEPGLCIIGLLGNSAAMSSTVLKEENRISSILQSLLNENATNGRCRKFRVLNLGVLSYHAYQAVQVFLYYKNLLDGAIFYLGNGECMNPMFLSDSLEPPRFPSFPVRITPPEETIKAARNIRDKIRAVDTFKKKFPVLMRSQLVKMTALLFEKHYFLELVDHNQRWQKETRGKDNERYPITDPGRPFPLFAEKEYLYGDEKLRRKVLNYSIDSIFTEPLENAAVIAAKFKIPVFTVIQPMLATSDKKLTKKEKSADPWPIFQKICLEEVLPPRFKRLQAIGMPVHDLNKVGVFEGLETDAFEDFGHTNDTGNRYIAKYLFSTIQSQWMRNGLGLAE